MYLGWENFLDWHLFSDKYQFSETENKDFYYVQLMQLLGLLRFGKVV